MKQFIANNKNKEITLNAFVENHLDAVKDHIIWYKGEQQAKEDLMEMMKEAYDNVKEEEKKRG